MVRKCYSSSWPFSPFAPFYIVRLTDPDLYTRHADLFERHHTFCVLCPMWFPQLCPFPLLHISHSTLTATSSGGPLTKFTILVSDLLFLEKWRLRAYGVPLKVASSSSEQGGWISPEREMRMNLHRGLPSGLALRRPLPWANHLSISSSSVEPLDHFTAEKMHSFFVLFLCDPGARYFLV